MAAKIDAFIEAPNSGGNWKKVLLVVHLTISPEVKGAARGVVAFWNRARSGSTQYVVDNAEIIQAVRETAYAWSAGTTANKWGIHVEHCGFLQTLRQWRDEYSSAELKLSAPLFADLSAKYDIPIRWLTVEQIRHAVKTGDPRDGGLCTHADITKAFPGETSHTDPGVFFPKAQFLDMVKAAAKPKPAPKPEPKPARTDAILNVASANIRHALPGSDVKATIARLAKDSDIICLQEMAGRRAHVEAAADLGFDSYIPDVPEEIGETGCPILWRADSFTLKHSEVYRAVEPGAVPREAAGPSRRGIEFIARATLVHKATGRTVHVFNLHLPPSLQFAPMLQRAEAEVRFLADVVKPARGQVLVCGDWNSTKPLDLAGAVLRDAGFRSNHEVLGTIPTHTTRAIDAVLFRGPALKATAHQTLSGLPSDHKPLLVRFALTARSSK